MHCIAIAILTCAVCATAVRAPAADDVANNVRVTGTVALPDELESFVGRMLEIRMYKVDPLLADAPADLVDTVEVPDFCHEKGTETRKTFELGADAALELHKTYYLTCFVLDGGERTHMGEVPGQFMAKVLTNGAPREVTFQVRAVR